MVKYDPKKLDQLAELELEALLAGLEDEEMKRSPAFLEKVRKFLKDNRLETTPDNPKLPQLQKITEELPIFENEVTVN